MSSLTEFQLQQLVRGQIRWPAALPQGKYPGLRWIRGCVRPRYGLDDLEQSVFFAIGIQTPELPTRNLDILSTTLSRISSVFLDHENKTVEKLHKGNYDEAYL